MSALLTRRARSMLGSIAAKVDRSVRRKLLDGMSRRLECLGCGCTEERACEGGCAWHQPGICTTCARFADVILLGNARADRIVKSTMRLYVRHGFRSFPAMSLAAIAWLRDRVMAEQHRDLLKEGAVLAPFTTITLGKICISLKLAYRPPKGSDGMRTTFSYRIRFKPRPR